ncbi:hypothetical protein E1B28_001979 [Marasmius oreades]|uniref:EthD domain-containing protein n=1 Tax=Marasmius oreades TaxID=181124 RepID=A0A9P7V4P8_9AGAR|nr:uncharacterized protein E1B28_001979 [Marasmius oreades]KAG7100204.1 hypothetical protein E1B28_001979 [Marasmius oreades]
MDLEITKKNILKYEQLHVNQEWKERLSESQNSGRTRVPDYDGVVVFEGESLEKIAEVVQHPEYIEKVISDASSKLFKAETVHGAFNIATIIHKPPSGTGGDAKLPEVPGPEGIVRQDHVERLLVLIHKKDGLSQAEFSNYWLNVHALLVKPSLVTNPQVTKHKQLHAHQGSGLMPGNTSDWDGIGVIKGESIVNFAVAPR